jgi:hypothetical protein
VLNDGKSKSILLDHPDVLIGHGFLMAALGTANTDFTNGLLSQLIKATSQDGQIDETGS